jgi:hypothetical protein
LRRADAVDDLDRRLDAVKGKRPTEALRDDSAGLFAALKRLFLPNIATARLENLEAQRARARAALRIAVDELHQAHCQQLRTAPWSGSLLAPTEAGLRDANDDYHPWNRVLMSGKRALQALRRIDHADDPDLVDVAIELVDLVTSDLVPDDNRRIEAMNRAADPIRSFVNALRLLSRDRPEAGTPQDSRTLTAIADKLGGVRSRIGAAGAGDDVRFAAITIKNLMDAVARSAGPEFDEVEAAEERLEAANQQIGLAAWSKIPARLRAVGR